MWLEFRSLPTWLQIALWIVLFPLVFAIRLWQTRWPRPAKVLSIAALFVTFVALAEFFATAHVGALVGARAVARNGKILYYLNWGNDDRVLRSVGADGRDDRRIAATVSRPGVDADGDCIDDHTNRRICFPLEDAAWSPDGGRVAYARAGGGLYVAQEDGSRPRRVARGWIDGFDWSPDGRRLVYIGGNHLYVTSASVGRPRLLSRLTVAGSSSPRWSPNGARILFGKHAYVAGTVGNDSLWTIRADGRGAQRLASVAGQMVGETEWSPNGKRVAFVVTHGASHLNDVSVINRDGSGRRLLTRGGTAALASGSPRWSPDGRWIAFTGEEWCADSPGCDLEPMMLVALSGGPAVPVGLGVQEFNPVWSPDGRKLAFYGYGGLDSPQGIVVKTLGAPDSDLVLIVSGDAEPIDWQRGR